MQDQGDGRAEQIDAVVADGTSALVGSSAGDARLAGTGRPPDRFSDPDRFAAGEGTGDGESPRADGGKSTETDGGESPRTDGGSTPSANQAPTVTGAVGPRSATEDSAFLLDLSTYFADADTGDVLTFAAGQAGGGALPAWLSFNPTTGVLSGTAGDDDIGVLTLQVTATDSAGASAQVDFQLTVNNVNDAPVLITAGSPVLTAIAEDTAAPAGDRVASIVIDGSITDPDGAIDEAIAVTSVDDSNGTWEFSTDGGSTFSAIGGVSESSALLLDGAAIVRFVPNADFHGQASFGFKAWDKSSGSNGQSGVDTTSGTAFSAASESASITVTAVADAPVLDTSGAPALTSVAQNSASPTGNRVAEVVIDGSITDVDGPVAEAIAVTGVDDANGTWEYSTDGGSTFSAIGAVSDSSALLLDGNAVIRFVPDAGYTGTSTFDYKAWDQTSGGSGQSGVDTTGGAAFSAASETASVTVTATNSAPVLDVSGTPVLSAIAEDTTAPSGNTVASIVVDGSITDADGAREAIAVTSIDNSNGTWEYSTDGGSTFSAIGAVSDSSALLLDGNAVIRFVPNAGYDGTATFGYKAWDRSSGSNGQTGVDTTAGDAFSTASETASITVVPLASRVDFSSGSEFRLNSTTANDQQSPEIAALSDGGYVAVWQSEDQDGSNSGIYGQRYDANGLAVGGEFRVNSTTTNEQSEPAVAGLDGGGFVVVWTSNAQDGSDTGVFGQRYAANGDPVGDEFQVNSETSDGQDSPDIASLGDGGFVVIWESEDQDGSDAGVFGQRFDSNGNAVGAEFRVNSTTASDQQNAQVVALGGGGFVVVWQSEDQDADGLGIFAQRFDASGTAVGGEFRINTKQAEDQSDPSIAALDDGGFVVVWQSKDQDGDGTGVFGQRFDASGNAVEFEFQANTTTAKEQEAPSVTSLSDGGFVVAWQSIAQDGDDFGVFAQRYNADGDRVGREFQINGATSDAQTGAVLARLDNGSIIAAWESANQDGNGLGVFARQFDSDTASVTINAPTAAGSNVIDFAGRDNYVDLGQGNGVLKPGTGDFTVEAWFHYDGTNGAQTIVSKGGTIAADEGYRIHIDNGTLVVQASTKTLFAGAADVAASHIDLSGAGWYHVALVIDQEAGANASSVTGYLNGVSSGWTAGHGSISDNVFTTRGNGIDGTDPFLIGADNNAIIGKTDFFNSQISDVRVWNTARSQAEIQADLGRTLNGDEDGLIANWRLDGLSGRSADNSVAGGPDGTVVGSLTAKSATSFSTALDTAVQSRVTGIDLDDDTLSFSVSGAAANGNAVIDSDTGTWTYTPDSGFTGTDTFSYQISDGNGGTDTVAISVQVGAVA